eukprot:363691-Chlamydomonas_euryale.AAC.6
MSTVLHALRKSGEEKWAGRDRPIRSLSRPTNSGVPTNRPSCSCLTKKMGVRGGGGGGGDGGFGELGGGGGGGGGGW